MAESARERLLTQFRQLAQERVERINQCVMALEECEDEASGRSALRDLHGLKGEARMMGFSEVNDLVHEMEEVLRVVEPRSFRLSGGTADALLVASDAVLILTGATEGAPPEVAKVSAWLKSRIDAEGRPAPPPSASGASPEEGDDPGEGTPTASRGAAPGEAPANPGDGADPAGRGEGVEGAPADASAASGASDGPDDGASPASAPSGASQPAVRATEVRTDGVRIGSATLELLTSAATNLTQVAQRRELASTQRLAHARELAQLARLAEDMGPKAAVLSQRLAHAKDVAAVLHRQAKLLANEELRDLELLTEEIQALRMLPLGVLFEAYPRMVRDLSRELGKEVTLVIEGEATRADRRVVEALRDPLLHLVRNSLDHGLEPPAGRKEARKPTRGRLLLRAVREGERVLLSVEDDGVGLEPDALRRSAVSKGLLTESAAAALGDQAAQELVFVPGFSSKEEVTDISGRGVGLDVVKSQLQGLGGDVTLTSVPGQGTSFELRVPVSLTVAPLLYIALGDEVVCLTASQVAAAHRFSASSVHEIAGRTAVRLGDETYPYVSLASVLGFEAPSPPREGQLLLLLRGQGHTAAVGVDRVLEERTQPILPLRGILSKYRHLSGASRRPDGSLSFVVSAVDVVASLRGKATTTTFGAAAPRAQQKESQRTHRILVVDDSPLTRELLASLLESAGYEIVTASDGIEAEETLQREQVDMVVTDLEMPRRDGLELTRLLKSGPHRDLPVVIITTRGGDEDRRRGMEAGADGYVAKGDLARQDLVDVVARLLG